MKDNELRWLITLFSVGAFVLVWFLAGEDLATDAQRDAAPTAPNTPSIAHPPSSSASIAAPIAATSNFSLPTASATRSVTDKPIWQSALTRARIEPLSASIHRAAVSGDVLDIATARWMRGVYCKPASLPIELMKKNGTVISDERIARASQLKEQCDLAGMRAPFNISIKNDRGLGSLASNFLEAASGAILPDPNDRKGVLNIVKETGSLQLLDAVSGAVILPNDLPALGLSPAAGIPPMVDLALVDLAIKIAACSERGDCEKSALNRVECSTYSSCVKDLRDFPKEKIYGSRDERVFFLKSLELEPAQLETRWNQISKFITTIY